MGGVRALELGNYLSEIKSGILGLSHGKKIVCSIFIIGVFLTIGLSGAIPPQNLQVVNGKQYLSTVYSEAPNATIGYQSTAPSAWSLSGGTSAGTADQLNSPSIVNFSGFFQPSSTGSNTQITRNLFVNVRAYPIVFIQIQVTQGVYYGIRFFTSNTQGTVPLWNNSDILDHRPGTGSLESIQLNVEDLAEQNIGTRVNNITQVEIYVERPALNSTTTFSLVLQNMEFLNYRLVTYQNDSSYHAVYLTFSKLPTADNSSWVLNKINLGLQLSATPGAAYEIYQVNGSNVLPGVLYYYSSTISSYDYSLYPKGSPSVFTDSLPPTHDYTIAIVAQAGTIGNVTVQSLSFVFTSADNASSPAVTAATVASEGSFWYGYLVFFLFVAPMMAAFFLYNKFRTDDGEDFKPWQVIAAVSVGIICRLALAPVSSQPFDISVYATSARGWFEFGSAGTSLGPTLPLTFFLYWVPYSFYALLLKLGLHDFYILGHTTGFFETIFLKTFPITADLFVTYLIMKFYPGKVGKLFAFFYLLNPLSIYVSSVWGQYEASTISFIVLGFVFLFRKGDEDSEERWPLQDLKASIAFTISALIELVGLIPLTFLVLKSLFTRPLKITSILILSPLVLLVVYPPEFHLIYLIAAAAVGASSVLLLAQPHTPYTLISNFPQVAALHPLIILLGGLAVVFIARRKYDLKNLLTYTLVAFLGFMIFSAQQPQWWVFILPLGLVYALVSEKYSVGIYMLVFGAMTAFLILSFTQGSGYMLFGSSKYNVFPGLEDLKHGIDLFTVTTTIGALTLVGYVLAGDKIAGTRPLLRSSIILACVFIFSFLLFSVAGASL